MAVAKLKFTAAAPGVSPDHGDNGLKDDETGQPFDNAVGYPLWLWADGGTLQDRTVSDAEGGQQVSIRIAFDGLTWNMGDGTTLNCGEGTRWTSSNHEAGESSPTCGHVYEKKGGYTITATTSWTITWRAGGQTGTIPYAIGRSRAFQVGELQVIGR